MEVRLVPGIADDAFRASFEASFIGGMESVLQTMGLSRDDLEKRMRTEGSRTRGREHVGPATL